MCIRDSVKPGEKTHVLFQKGSSGPRLKRTYRELLAPGLLLQITVEVALERVAQRALVVVERRQRIALHCHGLVEVARFRVCGGQRIERGRRSREGCGAVRLGHGGRSVAQLVETG